MTEITFIHDNLYADALKMAKGVVSKSHTRPILMYSLHTEDGTMWATDSHRLLRIKNIHGYTEETLVLPQSGMIAKGGNFPRLDSLIKGAESDCKPALVLNKEQISIWMNIFKGAHATLKALKAFRNNVVDMRTNSGCIEIVFLEEQVKFTLPGEIVEDAFDYEKISFNAEYMKQALETFMLMGSEEVTISIENMNKPFLLTDSKKVDYMILPVRTY